MKTLTQWFAFLFFNRTGTKQKKLERPTDAVAQPEKPESIRKETAEFSYDTSPPGHKVRWYH